MNILQAMALAGLIPPLVRIQLSDESWSDQQTRELVNLIFFVISWVCAMVMDPYLPWWLG